MFEEAISLKAAVPRRLKVLHIAETLPGGPASYLKEILPSQVSLFGRDNVGVLVPEQQVSHLANFDGRILTFNRSGRNLNSFFSLEGAINRAIDNKWDVVHLHSSFAGAIFRMSPRIKRRFTGKLIYCAHCWSFDRPCMGVKEWMFASLEKRLSFFTDAIVSISPHETELLIRHGFPIRKIKEITSGISDLSSARFLEKREAEKIKFLFVGRLDEQKGVDLLLKRLADFDRSYELTVVGASVLGNTKGYIFPADTKILGWVPRDDIFEIMRRADYLLLPSRWEGMPLVALEALRAGLPIIANNIGATRALSEGVVGGVRPVNIIDFNEFGALSKFFRESNLNVDVLSRAARDLYLNCYTANVMNSKLIDMYFDLLDV